MTEPRRRHRRDPIAAPGRSAPPNASSCSPVPASAPTAASPTSGARTGCGPRTPRPRSCRPSTTTSSDPEVRRAAWQRRLDTVSTDLRTQRRPPGARRPRAPGRARTAHHPEHRRPPPAAGTSTDKLVEIHGTTRDVVCLSCDDRAPMERALERVRAGEDDPACRSCGGILKSATISFGQGLVEADLRRADAGGPSSRPDARRRVDPRRLSHRQRRAPGQGARRRRRSSSTAAPPRWTTSPTSGSRARSPRSCRLSWRPPEPSRLVSPHGVCESQYPDRHTAGQPRRRAVDLSKLSLSDKIIGGTGIVLLLDLLAFPWHSIDLGPFGGSFTRTAIQSPNGIWGVLALLLTAAVVAVLAVQAFKPETKLPEIPVTWNQAIFYARRRRCRAAPAQAGDRDHCPRLRRLPRASCSPAAWPTAASSSSKRTRSTPRPI